MSTTISLRDGSIYISAQDYTTYFKGVTAVIVLIRDQTLQILPVQNVSAGGYVLKIRNAKGDRVVTAPDIFAEYGLGQRQKENLSAQWSRDLAALVCDLPDNQVKESQL